MKLVNVLFGVLIGLVLATILNAVDPHTPTTVKSQTLYLPTGIYYLDYDKLQVAEENVGVIQEFDYLDDMEEWIENFSVRVSEITRRISPDEWPMGNYWGEEGFPIVRSCGYIVPLDGSQTDDMLHSSAVGEHFYMPLDTVAIMYPTVVGSDSWYEVGHLIVDRRY